MEVLWGAVIAAVVIVGGIILAVENWARLEPWLRRFEPVSDFLLAGVWVLLAISGWAHGDRLMAILPAIAAVMFLLVGWYKLRRRLAG